MRTWNRNGRIRTAAAVGGLVALAALAVRADSCKTEATYTLPNIGLSDFLADTLPGLGAVDDHGVDLGGIGSDLWHGEDDGCGIYWMITDRGPNGADPRTFPVPEFTPFILKVRTHKGKIEILDAIPITGPGSAANGVTGVANLVNTTTPPAANEPIYEVDGVTPLATNSNGLDTEGLVRTEHGDFWIVEEYGPSILKVNRHGRVVTRFLPVGFTAFLSPQPSYATDDSGDSIPAIFGLKRKLNRGFEGIALSPDERTLYVALQSPLLNPDTATGNAARNTRILAFDIKKEKVVAEYVYRFQFTGPGANDDEFDVPSIPAGLGLARPRDMKVSGLAMVDKYRMLVLERTDFKAKIYSVDLRDATNILDTKWDDVTTSPTLETLNADGALESNGIHPLPKEFVIELDSTMGYPQKIEGLTILDGKTIAIANDNDFGVGTFPSPTFMLQDTGIESKIIVIGLDKPLKGSDHDGKDHDDKDHDGHDHDGQDHDDKDHGHDGKDCD